MIVVRESFHVRRSLVAPKPNPDGSITLGAMPAEDSMLWGEWFGGGYDARYRVMPFAPKATTSGPRPRNPMAKAAKRRTVA